MRELALLPLRRSGKFSDKAMCGFPFVIEMVKLHSESYQARMF
jgi:hypothetical protein